MGRPHADAILHAWFGGSEAGNAIADCCSVTSIRPASWPMSFPRSVGQCPIHYAEPPTGRPIDKIGVDVTGDAEIDPTAVTCSANSPPRAGWKARTRRSTRSATASVTAPSSMARWLYKAVLRGDRDVLTASITVRNGGAGAGEEIVQLYISDPVASRSRPMRS